MAERLRSRDGHRETDDILGESGTISQAGRSGGQPARRVASIDEKKRAFERPAGATRVTESLEKGRDGGEGQR
ncbi:hypothetical protein [Acidimangrovimonas sediminis]|uniref:hypothetical protein n=1 Tax=Acidimangrovimonas sediminis TaxID=2056283 RepID=UPI000C80C0BE|nr:hypothetical protein [Acidimangrovimonas sediminis]